MMEVKDPSHGPKRGIMQKPSDEEPSCGVDDGLSFFEHDIRDGAALFADCGVDEDENENYEEADVTPPNQWVSEQVNPLIVAGEKLALEKSQFVSYFWLFIYLWLIT